MVDRAFADARLAELYDALCEGRPDFAFYLPLVMSARSVLDVGCGTGALLHRAREAGHTGRLCGLDPAVAMLDVARRRSDIEWVHGDLTSVAWAGEFDLVVMTGHAFQVFLEDDELRSSLAAIRSALTDDGRFVFETRVAGDRVSFTATYTSPAWDQPKTSHSTLRFLDAATLSSFVTDAGLTIEHQFGDWNRQPLTATSREIITTTRRVRHPQSAREQEDAG